MAKDKDNKNAGVAGEGTSEKEKGTSEEEDNEVEIVGPKKEIKTETKMEKNEAGLYVPVTTVQVKEQHYVKQISSNGFAVVKGNGEVVRVYKKQKGCDDPKESAAQYALKLSTRFQ